LKKLTDEQSAINEHMKLRIYAISVTQKPEDSWAR